MFSMSQVYDANLVSHFIYAMHMLASFQMPEEQAFCVLVKMMFDYGLRDLFKQGFEELHLKFYQLERLMQVNTHRQKKRKSSCVNAGGIPPTV